MSTTSSPADQGAMDQGATDQGAMPGWARWLIRLVALICATVIGLVLFSLLAQSLASSAVHSVANSLNLQVVVPQAGDFSQLEERSMVLSSEGIELATLHSGVNRQEVGLDDLPHHVWQALIAAEDRSFFEHEGYDPNGIARALFANFQAGGVTQGGSTITQQLAKATVGDDTTLERKIEELLVAMGIEERFSKEEILGRYVNEVYFGYGSYGVGAAAEEFFGVTPQNLRPEQAALLAAMVRAPGLFDPRDNPDQVTSRRDAVLRAMAAEDYLTDDVAEQLTSLPLGVLPHRAEQAREPYIVEAVKQEFFNNPAFGETREDRIQRLFSGGLEITTTIDPELQRHAERVVRERFPTRNQGTTGAIASVDPRSGRIVAAAFGRDFSEEQFNLALQGRRQPGSAYKSFVLAEALSQGFPLSFQLEGENGLRFPAGPEYGLGPDDNWVTRGVQNYGGSSYGRMDMRQALTRSVNTAFAQLGVTVGMENVVERSTQMGISPAAYDDQLNPSISLGGLSRGTTPMEMASAYGTFAFGGQHATPHVIDKVTDHHGEVIYESTGDPEQVLEPDVNTVMVDVMQDVVTQGTGTAANLPGWEVGGKTGTTQENRDAWFVGFTPVLSTAVWIGNPDDRETLGGGVTGGGIAAPMWQDFMSRALEGVEPEPFPTYDGDISIVEGDGPAQVPNILGRTEVEAVREVIQSNLVPVVQSAGSGRGPANTVVQTSPGHGRTLEPGEEVILYVVDG